MNVEIIEATENPDRLAARSARGDYRNEWVGKSEHPFESIMEPVEGETLEEKTETLLKHCFKRGHHGVFEHPNATFAVEGVSRSCMSQLTRHRHASFDVQSLRYTTIDGDPKEVFCHPPSFEEDEVTTRNGVEEIEMAVEERDWIVNDAYETAMGAYKDLMEGGVPNEDARMVLPIGTLVNMTFTMNIRAIMHLFSMRLKADSQWEARAVCQQMLEECKQWAPLAFEQYEESRPMKLTP